jgi:hypothetical protein
MPRHKLDKDDFTPNQMIRKEELEELLERSKQKYLDIINILTDHIEESGCKLEHPFDKDKICIKNVRADKYKARLNKLTNMLEGMKDKKLDQINYSLLIINIKGKNEDESSD